MAIRITPGPAPAARSPPAGLQRDGGGHDARDTIDVAADDHHPRRPRPSRARGPRRAPPSPARSACPPDERQRGGEGRHPSERNCSSYCAQASSITWRDSAAMMGAMRELRGDHRGRREQESEQASGPAREATGRPPGPTTTGGMPIAALRKTISTRRPESAPTATAAPAGIRPRTPGPPPGGLPRATAMIATRRASRSRGERHGAHQLSPIQFH